MRTKIKIGKNTYHIDISEIKENLLKIRVDDEDYFFTEDRFQNLVPIEKKDYSSLKNSLENGAVCGVSEEKEIKAPIAGTLSKIYVREGQEIKPGKVVATLISMKMENEIISETCGKVKEIKVKEGQFINANEVLVTLE